MQTHQHHNIPFFDSLLLATATRVGCSVLLSEDLQHQRTIDGLTVINPFQISGQELNRLLT